MITDTQYAAWLEDSSARRVILFEIGVNSGGSEITRYLSTRAYGGGSTSTPYQAIVAGGIKVTESISLTSEPALSAGDIEIYNVAGERDAWLDDIWANHAVQVYAGDVRWDRTDFRLIFSGVVADIGSKSRDRLNLKLRDKLQRLNTPVTDTRIGGSGANADALQPVLLGECFNLSPVLTNDATKEYAYGSGANEGLIEVRVDGKPRTDISSTPGTGRFTFTGSIGGGQVTCSAQGDKPSGVYSNTIAPLVQRLLTGFGKAADRFTTSDIDTANFSAFNSANPQPVGLAITDRMNVLIACQQLASSVGAQLVCSPTGLARLVQWAMPATASTEIRASQQLDRSIAIVDRTDVAAAVKLGYCRNWTEQPNLQTGLPPAHKELFANPWRSVTVVDSTVQAAYKLDAEPLQQDTCLLVAADAQAEANRRLAIVKQPRTTYRFEGTPGNMLLTLGQAVKLYSSRFGLAAGKVGLVTSLARDWGNFHVTVEVTV